MLDNFKTDSFEETMMAVVTAVMTAGWQIPGGEEKSTWDLMFDPYTRYLGNLFYLTIIMLVAWLIWAQTDGSLGPPLIWVTVSSAFLSASGLITGWGSIMFTIIAAFAVAIAGLRAAVRRDMV